MDLNGNYRLVASFDGGSNGNLKNWYTANSSHGK